MEKLKRAKNGSLKIQIELKELQKEERWPEINAYLFNKAGRLIAQSQIIPDATKIGLGIANFERVPIDEDSLTVKIGSAVKNVSDLARQRLEVQRYETLPQKNGLPTVSVEKLVWGCWIKIPYLVTGTVEKLTDGKKAPVCVGEVDIYDVDVHCFLRLPDLVIERVRDSIIDVIIDPPPFDLRDVSIERYWWDDDDWCGTPPKPHPPFNLEIREKINKLPRDWSFAANRVTSVDTVRSRFDTMLANMTFTDKQIWLNSETAANIKLSQLVYTNTQQFRTMLVDNFQSFRFWLCWYPWIYWLWWPWCRFYGLEQLGTAILQSDGSFSTVVPLSICRKDTPDLWFRVRQNLNGTEHVIYARYPVLCHTYWNHPSGDPVNLLVTDPNAVACVHGGDVDKTGVYVMPLGIGDDGWYQIEQAHLKSGEILNADRGLYNATDPYGTRLDIRMQFHDGLRSNGVHYYRWSYTPGAVSGSSVWTYIDTPVTHRFLTQIGTDFYIAPEKLGPNVVGGKPGLFEVPDPAKDWIGLNRDDRAFAIWYTALWDSELNRYVPQVSDGRYTLRLEMFDAAGNNLNPTAAGAGWNFFLPISDQVGGVWPVDDDPEIQSDGSIYFNLWVDNTDTEADIQSVGLGGAATGECQFIEYNDFNTDEIVVTYVAYHKLPPQRDFLASYDLRIKRGISGTTVDSFSSSLPAPTATTRTVDVADLLRQIGAKGPYTRCAFAVELHTWPRNRDGYSRIRAYEDHDTSAFALMAHSSS